MRFPSRRLDAGDLGDFVANSIVYAEPDPILYGFNWFMFAFSLVLLVHSQFINKFGVYKSVRVLSELCSYLCFQTSVLVLIGYYSSGPEGPSPLLNAVVNDELIVGVTNLAIQLTDNYMFWYRYMVVVPKIPFAQKLLVHGWVGLVMCPWVITNFPMPLFIDVNGEYYAFVNLVLNLIYAYGQIAFNLYFSYEFATILWAIKFDPHCKYTAAAGMIAVKTIIHCVISCLGCILITYFPPMGVYYQDLLNMISLHFLFNYKIESLLPAAANKAKVHPRGGDHKTSEGAGGSHQRRGTGSGSSAGSNFYYRQFSLKLEKMPSLRASLGRMSSIQNDLCANIENPPPVQGQFYIPGFSKKSKLYEIKV